MMRNLAVRLILWLCNRFDVWPVEEARRNMGGDKKARSLRFEEFAREEGGLFDLLDKIKAEYLAKMGQVKPGDAKTLETLAIGARVADQLAAQVRSVIAAGEIEAVNEDRRAKMNVTPIRKSI
ncbi:hypothetical protein [Pelagerythrobacter marinus]|nr:hypothetical protein [Pelagerythrobacter marinus]